MEFFISGVREIDGNCERVEKDEDAQFFTLYRSECGPSYAVQDFASKEDAEKHLGLLEALQEQVFLYEHDGGCREITEYKRAKAAISKAIGE